MRICSVGFTALSLALCSIPAAGQTRFAWPDTAVDLKAYTTIEQCQAAVGRVRQSVASREERVGGIWRDTMPPDPAEDFEPLAAAVGETARTCLARFAVVDSVPPDYFRTLVALYLLAGWDAKAQALVQRHLAAVAPQTDREWADVLGHVIDIYAGYSMDDALRVRPRRIVTAHEIAAEYLPRLSDRGLRLDIYATLLSASSQAQDSVRVQRIGARVIELVDSLTDAELRSWAQEGHRFLGHQLYEIGDPAGGETVERRLYAILNLAQGQDAALDSLRKSTAAFVRFKRAIWAQATGRPPEAYTGFGGRIPIGERAPALEGDFWFGRGDSAGTRPTSGRVSLVVFLGNQDCAFPISPRGMYPLPWCAGSLSSLRRLADRFPALEITIVAPTRGYFLYLKKGITPSREAELTRRWLDSFGLHRATLTVTNTEYWRLPEPDGRRINRHTANRSHYTFGKSWRVSDRSAFLIDQHGIIVHAARIARFSELEFAELIEILLERYGSST